MTLFLHHTRGVAPVLEGAALRILGRALGVDRILIRDRDARVNFRPGVEPRLTVLERPLRDHQVEVEVRRLAPLSLALHRLTHPTSSPLNNPSRREARGFSPISALRNLAVRQYSGGSAP